MSTFTLTIAPQSYSLTKISNDQVFEAITGAVQVASRTGNRWALSMTWVRGRSDYMALCGALDQLDGKQQRLKIPVAKIGYIRGGVGGGSPLVKGAHTAGTNTLTLKGLPANTTGILKPGDYVQVGNQLCRLATILSSTGSPNTAGSCTIWPELHKNYADGAAVDYLTPAGVFFLMSEGNYGLDNAGIGTLTADFVQDVLA